MKVADAQENGELFINYFNLVFKRDDCVLLHEDYFSVTLIMTTSLKVTLPSHHLWSGNFWISWTLPNLVDQMKYHVCWRNAQNLCPFLSAPCSINKWTVVVFQKHGKLQIWFQFSSPTIEMVENYRGISLLCIISKVLEKCVFLYVFPFFQPQIYHLQDGFVSGRSCVTSLFRSTHAFAKALHERKQVDTVFLDYSKVFDSVSFNCLLKELLDVSIRGKLLSWSDHI